MTDNDDNPVTPSGRQFVEDYFGEIPPTDIGAIVCKIERDAAALYAARATSATRALLQSRWQTASDGQPCWCRVNERPDRTYIHSPLCAELRTKYAELSSPLRITR